MKRPHLTKFILLALLLPGVAGAQLELMPDSAPQNVFAGGVRRLDVMWHNSSDKTVRISIGTQLYQASSATVVPIRNVQPWKELELLPHQTVLENFSVTVPSIVNCTRFIVQWLADTNRVIGHTDFLAYPTNLFSALKPFAANQPIGVFDPGNRLKPLLSAAGLEIEDLEATGARHFTRGLAIIDEASPSNIPGAVWRERIIEMTRTGVAVVWIKPPPEIYPELEPAVCSVVSGWAGISIVQARVVSDLANNPVAQLNLIRSANLAVKPDLLSCSNR